MNIEELFPLAIEHNASDIHIANGLSPIFRIDGILKRIENYPAASQEDILGFLEKNLNKKKKEYLFENKELDFSFAIPQKKIRLRVNAFWEKNNLALAMRIIWPHIPSLGEIGAPPIFSELLKKHDGLILITGPAGCGKSTTLAAMINYINENRNCHIITLEDPIEYIFESKKSIIAQRELGQDMLSFASAMKRVLRQDPNVIMVGELRDLETIALAVTLAETGHLIFGTLHTPSTAQTISRIIDIFPPNQQTQIKLQLSMVLKGIICQHLVPKIGGGRTAIREVLINTSAVANLIRENQIQQIVSSIQTGMNYGMFTMNQDIERLLKQEIISEKTALDYSR